MRAKITRDVLESYLNCKYKGYLKLTDQQGTKSDYETLLTETRAEVRLAAIDKIIACCTADDVVRNVVLTPSVLKQGPLFVLDVTLEDDSLSLCFDGLKKVEGRSKLGNFHYMPLLFDEGRRVRNEHRSLLELYGLLLSRIQGRAPGTGIIWHGRNCQATRVRLHTDGQKAERLLEEVKRMQGGEAGPSLILNNHCQVCEFRQRCHDQAAKDDNISLLRGMKEKEIGKHRKKGIVTVTQLSYTGSS